MALTNQIGMYWRFARDLRGFLNQPITLEMSRKVIRQRLRQRQENLLAMIRKAVYENENSPYLKLLKIAGCEYGDFEKMLGAKGIDDTLKVLSENGVYVSIEEFKGKKDISRSGRTFRFKESDFDNPFTAAHLQAESSGSGGAGTRSLYDLDFLTANLALYNVPLLDAIGALEMPIALWMPAMPGVGPINLLCYSKGGNVPVKWFSPLEKSGFRPSFKNRVITRLIISLAASAGAKWPKPEYIAYDNAVHIAEWMADTIKKEGGCVLDTYTSAALRVCRAARENGLDISGARFVVGGEPVTEKKRQEIESVGAVACVGYGMSEAGMVGAACFKPTANDDMHIFEDSYALIQHRRPVPHADVSVDAFLFTSLLPSAPKLLLNVESGDYGIVEKRECSCCFCELGLKKHVYNVRGFDRLTSEGMNFFGGDLVRIIEEILPARFGGTASDYQVLEEEDEQASTRMSLLVNPTLGDIDDEELVSLVLDELAKGSDATRMMSRMWLQTGTLRVKRMAPLTAVSGKLLPLHIQKVKPPKK